LEVITLKGMARKAEDRYQNAREFAQALEQWLATATTFQAVTTHPQAGEARSTAIRSELPDGSAVNVTINHPSAPPGQVKVKLSERKPGKKKRRRLTISITLAFSLLFAVAFGGIWMSKRIVDSTPAEKHVLAHVQSRDSARTGDSPWLHKFSAPNDLDWRSFSPVAKRAPDWPGDRTKTPPKDWLKFPIKDTARPPHKDKNPPRDGAKPPPEKDKSLPKDGGKKPRNDMEYFPLRALLVSVNNYLYANPLPYGNQGANTGDLAGDLERFLHFPKSQVTELSDGAAGAQAHPPVKPVIVLPHGPGQGQFPGARAQPPVKPVIEQAVTDFLAASRPMDRVLLLFTGHAVAIDKAVYLVPIEGDLEDAKTLIPLTWVYETLARCKARQKVLVLDVCRLDPAQGKERPSTGAMGEVLDAALKNPPAGVQVWSSCVARESALEFGGNSLFLEGLCRVLRKKAIKGIQEPTDPLPVDLLQAKVKKYVETALKGLKLKQTPRLTGQDPGKGADYDPDAELPPALVIRDAPALKYRPADKALVQGILDEIDGIPSAKGLPGPRLRSEVMPRFSAKLMDRYKVDYVSLAELDQKLKDHPKDFPLRQAVREATRLLQQNSGPLKNVLPGKAVPLPKPVRDQVKRY
jgi:hypothetical protein